jgi:uncharacterized membrane protein YgaE (UPF0421/DUF939 family)
MHGGMARIRDPLLWTDVLQLAKTALAAVLAWVIAVDVLSLEQSFLAPWAALLTMHATVYRTFARGLQQAAAAVIGVLLAFGVGVTLGVGTASLAIVLLAGLAVGTLRPMRAESTTAAATALVVLLTGAAEDGSLLLSRLADTSVGIATALAVNLAVWPPLRDRSAARRVDALDDALGALLAEIAEGLRHGDPPDPHRWVERTRELDHGIDAAWADVRDARESGRMNLRRTAERRVRETRDLRDVLAGLEQAVADTRSMARTIGRAGPVAAWDPGFRDAWLTILARAAAAVREADADAVRHVCHDLEDEARRLPQRERGGGARPVHGALVVNLRNILEAMAPVAAAQPVQVRRHGA